MSFDFIIFFPTGCELINFSAEIDNFFLNSRKDFQQILDLIKVHSKNIKKFKWNILS